MAKNQREVEDALFQIKNLEESLQKNAQGILSSTMKEEINSLVKESLKEQDEVEDEEEVEMDDEDIDTDNEEGDDDQEYDMDDMDDTEMMGQVGLPSDDDTVDMTGASDAEVLRVFRAMGDSDGVIVKRDDNMIHLSDNENDAEYIIQLSESMMDDDTELKEFGKSEFDMYSHHFGDDDEFSMEDDDEFSMEDDDEFSMEDDDMDFSMEDDDMDFSMEDDDDLMMKGGYGAKKSRRNSDETSETIYELELDDMGLKGGKTSKFSLSEFDDFSMEDDDFSMEDDEDFEYDEFMETEMMTSPIEGETQSPQTQKGPTPVQESKNRFKAKGTGMGNASKYRMSKKPNMEGGFKTVKKKANKTMGTGRAKFEYKEEVNSDGYSEKVKKSETKEAARTYGNGGLRGLRKGITPNRNLKESDKELELLRAKNDEYRKALDLFRNKLNEVAVFNSNLAYATRLFTEHSTTKQEKINILRRFDNVETLKESKTLYKSIKSELGTGKTSENTITESVQRNVERTPSTGSAVNLIESKTYENPQFLRMKDLMTKIK